MHDRKPQPFMGVDVISTDCHITSQRPLHMCREAQVTEIWLSSLNLAIMSLTKTSQISDWEFDQLSCKVVQGHYSFCFHSARKRNLTKASPGGLFPMMGCSDILLEGQLKDSVHFKIWESYPGEGAPAWEGRNTYHAWGGAATELQSSSHCSAFSPGKGKLHDL